MGVLILPILCLFFSLGALAAPITGILYNEDDTNRFLLAPTGKLTGGHLDHLVDQLAGTHVTTLSICICAKKANYDSRAWEPYWEGFDPSAGNDQAIFGDVPQADRPTYRQWLHNMLVLHEQGIDPNQRMIERCRLRGISPWISIRMNDVHDAHLSRSPLHSRFWMEHPEYWRYPNRFNGWNDRCFDYGQEAVRGYAMALIREVCERYDTDGIELDWNRFPLHFREGEETEKGRVLTEWLVGVRQTVQEAVQRRGHPILLVARVPADPEVSQGTGLDAIEWAKRGLIDHLIVAPFWATTDFDIPVERWKELLEGSGVRVTAGLEALVRPSPGAQPIDNTSSRRRGAALAALARGSEGIYVFNYFEIPNQKRSLLNQLDSIEEISKHLRSFVLTYRDINIPGKPIPAALPRQVPPASAAEFQIFLGPKPARGKGRINLVVKEQPPGIRVILNGRHCPDLKAGSYSIDPRALVAGYNLVSVSNTGSTSCTVEQVEVELGPSASPSRGSRAMPSPDFGFNPWPDRWHPDTAHGKSPTWWEWAHRGRDSGELHQE